MAEYQTEHSIVAMCRVLGVSRSGYYAWRERPPGPRAEANRDLLLHIRRFYERSHQTYGSPRITRDLQVAGIRCGKHRVARLMRKGGIVARAKRHFKVTTRRRKGELYAPDRLQRNFVAKRAHQVWMSDITYVWTEEGWLYLAVVMDLFSRAIVGWAASGRIDAQLVSTAIGRALTRYSPRQEVILHSDRGSQYTSMAVQTLIGNHRGPIVASHSQSCYDNAVIESMFHTLKTEWVPFEHYRTREEGRQSLFKYFDGFYNHYRRHSSLGYRTPAEMEALSLDP